MRRTVGVVLVLLCLVWGVFAAVDLKQALDVDRTLRGLEGDYAHSENVDGGREAGIAAAGEHSLANALPKVDSKVHADEGELLVAAIGLAFGAFLLAPRRAFLPD